MSHHIVTGPHPGQPGGGCMAQYNHYTLGHAPHHYPTGSQSNHQSYSTPFTQQPTSFYGQYGVPNWRPPWR
ncbi:hypothetical protein [Neobacillus kokaensis]|uniref:Uncharacterized protein n=1 Tax=Neobacillus kokaensis TaxID=2759023 RepID=A0ABQ3N6R9_9BACI|nr:hypothetical protein [Neobacillus kokaensis]GHI00405.1 hypothetical protein AM1BK_39470 [Neobacillus kokaensis]